MYFKKKTFEASMSVGLLIGVWCPRVKFTVEDGDENEGQESGLLVELEGKEEKMKHETDLWFSKVCSIVWSTRIQVSLMQCSSATSLLCDS